MVVVVVAAAAAANVGVVRVIVAAVAEPHHFNCPTRHQQIRRFHVRG